MDQSRYEHKECFGLFMSCELTVPTTVSPLEWFCKFCNEYIFIHISVSHSDCVTGAITLEGTNAGVDRGHVYFNGQPVCAEGSDGSTTWDINASNVVCKMLGFSSATTFTGDGCTYGGCSEGVPFALSGFNCTGSETHIADCAHNQTIPSNCGTDGATNSNQNDIVGVQCTGEH